jgi:hypothetical protein
VEIICIDIEVANCKMEEVVFLFFRKKESSDAFATLFVKNDQDREKERERERKR